MKKNIYIDPSYKTFNADKLFDLNDPELNRDDQLKPFYRLRENVVNAGNVIHTADHLMQVNSPNKIKNVYYSLGVLDNFEKIISADSAYLVAFVIMEPPVVSPDLYLALPRLTEVFDTVYVHNVAGHGYSLTGVDTNKLRKMYYPIPYNDVLLPYWEKSVRKKRIVVINGSHNPHARKGEQYSLRIQAMADLSKLGVVDLYGKGWNRWWSRSAFWLPYLNIAML